ncbi:hypothetical protein N7520_001295 [Penicillium odoratum]|uniref:uncharacterized protein n=1 Tax=Penicillium odoratum TaxID=1167516 RepID=UPI002547CDD4|nr:uncharacterized protein N7520_001295 [Penicillium odoratum]KAJ5778049.1 hypothetical protein N7520_001295 [Penicillium odoratum]
MTANADTSRELRNIRYLESQSSEPLSSNYIVQLLDSFTHEGPNRVHQCLIFELLGPSVYHILSDYREGPDPLEPEIIFRMTTQLLKAVRFIHSAGMCHGDISASNIAFICTAVLEKTEEELFKVLGAPEIEELPRIDGTPLKNGQPAQINKSAEWVDWIDEDEEDNRLLDIGKGFFPRRGT